jgi:hypothetical protein
LDRLDALIAVLRDRRLLRALAEHVARCDESRMASSPDSPQTG